MHVHEAERHQVLIDAKLEKDLHFRRCVQMVFHTEGVLLIGPSLAPLIGLRKRVTTPGLW